MARWLAARTGTTAENSAADFRSGQRGRRFDRALDLRVAIAGPDAERCPAHRNCLRRPFLGLARGEGTELDLAHPETDTVSSGEDLPSGYSTQLTQDINVTLGQIRSETEPFKIT